MTEQISLKASIASAVAFGPMTKAPRIWWREKVLVCRVDGCMATELVPQFLGRYKGKTKIPCINGPDIPGIHVEVLDPMKSGRKVGDIVPQMLERVARLSDGRLVVGN